MPLFGKASKSPVELVRVLKESLIVLEKGADGKKQGRSQFCILHAKAHQALAFRAVQFPQVIIFSLLAVYCVHSLPLLEVQSV